MACFAVVATDVANSASPALHLKAGPGGHNLIDRIWAITHNGVHEFSAAGSERPGRTPVAASAHGWEFRANAQSAARVIHL